MSSFGPSDEPNTVHTTTTTTTTTVPNAASDDTVPSGFEPLPTDTEFYTAAGEGGTFDNFIGDVNNSDSESSFGDFEEFSQTPSTVSTTVSKSMADDVLEGLESDYVTTVSRTSQVNAQLNEMTRKLQENLDAESLLPGERPRRLSVTFNEQFINIFFSNNSLN